MYRSYVQILIRISMGIERSMTALQTIARLCSEFSTNYAYVEFGAWCNT